MGRKQTTHTHLCIDLEICGGSDAAKAVNNILDGGMLQDAINEYHDGGMRVISAVVRPAAPAHQDARRQSRSDRCDDCGEPAFKHGVERWPGRLCGVCADARQANADTPEAVDLRRTASAWADPSPHAGSPRDRSAALLAAAVAYAKVAAEAPTEDVTKLPVLVSPDGEVLTVHLTDEDEDGSLYLSLSHQGRGQEPILKLDYTGDRLVHGLVFSEEDRSIATVEFNAVVPADPDAPEPPADDCAACSNRGWSIYNGNEIQRCDDCKRYDTDEDAAEAVEKQLAEFLGTKGAK